VGPIQASTEGGPLTSTTWLARARELELAETPTDLLELAQEHDSNGRGAEARIRCSFDRAAISLLLNEEKSS
jgi:hypothetical protein